MTAKDRLRQFIENQKLTINQFCKKNSLSNSFFNNKSSIGSDKLLIIFRNYPDLNMDWVITGRGEMLLSKTENTNEWKEKYYQLLDLKFTVVNSENTGLKKSENVAYDGDTPQLSQAAEPEVGIKK